MPADARVRAALAVGSPDLFAALARAPTTGAQSARLGGKLRRYLIRMATRPTPYGLFAGVGLAEWGSSTDLRLAAGEPRTRTRPDMQWLSGLVARLEDDLAVRRATRLVANSSVLVRAGRVFLSETAPRGADQAGAAVSLRATGVVRRALELARTPIAYERLAAALVGAPGATPEKVERLITELCEHTVLLSDLRPPLTCPDPAGYLLDRLEGVPAAAEAASGLERLLASLERWDDLSLEDRPESWHQLVEQAGAVHPLAPQVAAFQVDMALPLEGRRVHHEVGAQAALAGELLLRLSPFPRRAPQLEAYRRAFETRYGRERTVPLLELLDPQFGLGPPADPVTGSAGIDPVRPAARQRALRGLALGASRGGSLVVELDDELLERLQSWSPADHGAPVTLDISVFVVARSAASLDAGDFQVVVGPNVGAGGAGRTMGRFAPLLGAEALAALSRTAAIEAARAPDRCRVEVVHSPRRARSANVAIRPAIRAWEIALGATPGVAWDRVVPLDELVVGVRDSAFFVYWAAGNAELAAVQGHMLNPAEAPAVARFLLDVAQDGCVQPRPFDWGSAATLPVLPRVQRGRVVLALARWRVGVGPGADELLPDPASAFPEALGVWRADWRVPRHVYLAAADNRLMLDLEDQACVELLREELRRRPPGGDLLLEEALPGPQDAWLRGPTGHHVVELVVPVARRGTPAVSVVGARPQAASALSRLRPPGSDWLYLKLYCASMLEDELIAGPLRTFTQFARSSGLADAWFFIRYADPDAHLRIRFHGDGKALVGPLLSQLCAWAGGLVEDGSCLRFSFETYEREVERYGGEPGMLLAEAIFAADSVAVAELLHLGGPPGLDRLALAILSVDDLLAGLGLAESDRLAWYRARAVLSREDGHDYRQRRSELRRLLGGPGAPAAVPGRPGLEAVLAARRRALEPLAAELGALARAGALSRPMADLCSSYVHLHCNRLAASAPASEERALQLLRRTREGLARSPVHW